MPRRLALLPLLALLLPVPASAYTCSRAGKDATVTQVWQSRCIPYAINTTSSSLLAGDEMRLLVKQSFEVWSSNACTDLTFKDLGTTTQKGDFSEVIADAPDQRNAIVAIEDQGDVSTYFNDPRLLAVTLTRYFPATGEIIDADILLNAVRFNFEVIGDPVACKGGGQQIFDLKNTLVHEMGHLIGFDHVGDQEATMYGSADTCEVIKRDLGQDDLSGLCTVYAKTLPARTCLPPATYTPSGLDPTPWRDPCNNQVPGPTDPGGCSCASAPGARSGSGLVTLLLAGLALISGRRSAGLLRRS